MADAPGDYELVVPQRGIWGTAGVGGWNIDKCGRFACIAASLRVTLPHHMPTHLLIKVTRQFTVGCRAIDSVSDCWDSKMSSMGLTFASRGDCTMMNHRCCSRPAGPSTTRARTSG